MAGEASAAPLVADMAAAEDKAVKRLLPARRWLTTEFFVYYALILNAARVICTRVYVLSARRTHPEGTFGAHAEMDAACKRGECLDGMEPGWMTGRYRDMTDPQWSGFRRGLPLLAVAMTALLAGAAAVRLLAPRSPTPLLLYWLAASLGYIGYLHGASLLLLAAVAAANFGMARAFAGIRAYPFMLWGLNCACLVAAVSNQGLRFEAVHPTLAFLDQIKGELRWFVYFNIVLLRLVSYGMDAHWAAAERVSATDWSRHRLKCEECWGGGACYHWKQEHSLPKHEYLSLLNFATYLTYAPLYLAGPICSFNAFLWQFRPAPADASKPSSDADTKRRKHAQWVLIYALRLLVAVGIMEFASHFAYVNAMAKHGFWRRDDFQALEIGMLGYWMIKFVWLKFFIIWRFFRLLALIDGLDVVENMRRCVTDNYDIEGFWKNWHVSYNRWLVRYMYIPLGGASTRLLNVWVIFTFVALWHDMEWNLLAWAWLTCFFIVPEFAVKAVGRSHRLAGFRATPLFRHACALAGTINIFFLLSSCLAGFIVGIDGLETFVAKMFSMEGAPFLLGCLITIFGAVHIMFEWRAEEERRAWSPPASSSRLT